MYATLQGTGRLEKKKKKKKKETTRPLRGKGIDQTLVCNFTTSELLKEASFSEKQAPDIRGVPRVAVGDLGDVGGWFYMRRHLQLPKQSFGQRSSRLQFLSVLVLVFALSFTSSNVFFNRDSRIG